MQERKRSFCYLVFCKMLFLPLHRLIQVNLRKLRLKCLTEFSRLILSVIREDGRLDRVSFQNFFVSFSRSTFNGT